MNQRLNYLDAIRGLAIIGILFMNINSFSWPDLYDSFPSTYWNKPWDHFIEFFTYVFVQSNLYPVFAALFGISMSFIFNGAIRKGLKPYLVFSRRLLFLLLIGLTHGLFIWHGDILELYAILGFLLLPFYRLKTKTILATAAAIWIIPNLFYAILLFLMGTTLTQDTDLNRIQSVIERYHGGFLAEFQQNLSDWLIQYDIQTFPFIFISIFPMFLFGLAISKSGYLQKINERAAIQPMLWIGIGIMGLTLKSLPVINSGYLLFSHLSEAFGGPLMGLFYALTIIRFSSKLKRITIGLSFIGRMSMSNYLLQSLIGFVLFKVIGLYGYSSPVANIGVALFIISVQIFLSGLWMRNHTYGPIEGIWRKATYGKMVYQERLSISKEILKAGENCEVNSGVK